MDAAHHVAPAVVVEVRAGVVAQQVVQHRQDAVDLHPLAARCWLLAPPPCALRLRVHQVAGRIKREGLAAQWAVRLQQPTHRVVAVVQVAAFFVSQIDRHRDRPQGGN